MLLEDLNTALKRNANTQEQAIFPNFDVEHPIEWSMCITTPQVL